MFRFNSLFEGVDKLTRSNLKGVLKTNKQTERALCLAMVDVLQVTFLFEHWALKSHLPSRCRGFSTCRTEGESKNEKIKRRESVKERREGRENKMMRREEKRSEEKRSEGKRKREKRKRKSDR